MSNIHSWALRDNNKGFTQTQVRLVAFITLNFISMPLSSFVCHTVAEKS